MGKFSDKKTTVYQFQPITIIYKDTAGISAIARRASAEASGDTP